MLGDKGAAAFGAVFHCSYLQHLDLDSNCVGDTGAAALLDGLQVCVNPLALYCLCNVRCAHQPRPVYRLTTHARCAVEFEAAVVISSKELFVPRDYLAALR